MSDGARTVRAASAAAARKKKQKGRGGLIVLIVLLLLLGGAAALLYFNVNNLRNIVFDGLRDVPLIGGLIPDAEEPGPYDNVSSDEMIDSIEQLQRRVTSLTNERASLQQANADLQIENDRLREFEANQEQFRIEEENFLNGIVSQDPVRYFEWYMEHYPDQAEAFAQQAAGAVEDERSVKYYISIMEGMGKKEAGELMDILMDTNSTLVRDTMNALNDPAKAADIIENMDPQKAASLWGLMNPGI
ncbi:MAG: hypothetical protein LBS19_09710 [Clostridiales bacterium]|nr:hypothetical protein [Clostridiales bacterium]